MSEKKKPRPREHKTRKVSDMETGRAPRATKFSLFHEVAQEYLPRSGVERAPRQAPRSNVPADASSNHNDLHRGNGY